MQSKLLISVALFFNIVFSHSKLLNIDTAEESKVLDELEGFVTTLEANPTFQADVAALITALPAGVVQEVEQNPGALIGQVNASGSVPAWISAIPTPIVESLETLVAKPIKAVGDVEAYLEQSVEEPEFASAIFVLMTAVPKSVRQAFGSSLAGFLENIATDTASPSWVTNIPASVQSDIGSMVNQALSIIDKDLRGDADTTRGSSGSVPSLGYVQPTGTGSVVGYNDTNGAPIGKPIAFMGAATPVRMAAAWMAALGLCLQLVNYIA